MLEFSVLWNKLFYKSETVIKKMPIKLIKLIR